MELKEISIYPIKSLRGNAVSGALVEKRGLRHDRRWMITDREGMFLTQREFPRMALIGVEVGEEQVVLRAPEMAELTIPHRPADGPRRPVTVWNSTVEAAEYPDDVNQWLSEAVGGECVLFAMPAEAERHVNPLFDRGDDLVSFADGYPLLLIGEGSLEELNRRIAANGGNGPVSPLEMRRFRPNLVVAGSEPFEEDTWARIRVGEAVFRVVRPCARCAITTVDPDRGEFDGKEPLKTLATFRMAKDVFPDKLEELALQPNYVLFGENLIPENPGVTIRTGDEVEVLEYRS
ncbi:MAG: MOSC domain-containing protein [Acidobacteria bacterium]|nr:MOSC domain-containing protein [Acidobacteriota bacterium]